MKNYYGCHFLKIEYGLLLLSVVTHIGTRFINPWLRGYWIWRYFTSSSVKKDIQTVDRGLNLLRTASSKFPITGLPWFGYQLLVLLSLDFA